MTSCARPSAIRERSFFQKTFADIKHPEDVEPDWAQARRLIAGKIDSYTMEKRYIRTDRSIASIQLTGSLVRMALGEPHYLIGIVEDISAREDGLAPN